MLICLWKIFDTEVLWKVNLLRHIDFSNICKGEFLFWKYSICWKKSLEFHYFNKSILSYLWKTMVKHGSIFYIVTYTFGFWKGTILIQRGLADAAWENIFDTVLISLKAKLNWLEKDNISAYLTAFSFYEWLKFFEMSNGVVITNHYVPVKLIV